jgi:long-chain acyl-CoA synthetase
MVSSQLTHLARADELKQEPPEGTPYSVAMPGTEQPGRSRIYRAWNAQTELLKTLDANVSTSGQSFFTLPLFHFHLPL